MKQKLLERMKDWTDVDIAMHEIALCLELIPEDNFPKYKRFYWSNSEKSELLSNLLKDLVKIGFLDMNEDDYTYKVNPNFAFDREK
ncbi:hypothetical protein ASG01_14655 [Chryseobacterium sp. Leaf180]|uniref:hypothetical protein n=1 Tax=Chryseobacterium sp. Leaf180 TaxID=1736289 RepID=UPI0006F8E3E6|nr:hypothetical protein [Chryseobacterium sp. Leaf180]KQR91119.1 hypothetical protein ASG01_14655 [Chryseobacterium sp. Leaf180]